MNYLLFRILFLSALSLVNLFFVLFILVKKRGKFDPVSFDIFQSAIISFLFVLFSALYNLLFLLGHEELSLLMVRMSWIGGFLSSSFLMLVLDLTWPDKNRFLKTAISYPPALIMLLTAVLTDRVFIRFIVIRNVPVIQTGGADSLFRVVLFLIIASGILILRRYFKSTYGYRRKQLSYFIYGTVIYSLGAIFFGTFLPMLTKDLLIKDLIYDSVMVFSAIWIGFLAYAIIKYRLLEIETIFHKTLVWFIMSVLLLLPLFFFFYFTNDMYLTLKPLELTFFLFAVIYAFSLYRNSVQSLIDRLFQRKKYDKERIFRNFILDLSLLSGLDELENKIVRLISDNLYSESVVLFVLNNRTGSFEEFTKEEKKGISFGPESWIASFLGEKQRILEKDLFLYNPSFQAEKENGLALFEKMRSEICLPFFVNVRLVGFLFLGRKSNLKNYSLNDLELLEMLRSPVAIAIYNSVTYNMAITDPLTGLFNRNFLNYILENEISKCRRYGQEFCILFIDLDLLKQINDRYGHKTGDACLTALAGEIQRSARKSDTAARFGGDEFLLLMPNTGLNGAVQAAQRLCDKITRMTVTEGPDRINLSVSIGITPYNGKISDYNELLVLADQALYNAKARGRGRVEVMELADLREKKPV